MEFPVKSWNPMKINMEWEFPAQTHSEIVFGGGFQMGNSIPPCPEMQFAAELLPLGRGLLKKSL